MLLFFTLKDNISEASDASLPPDCLPAQDDIVVLDMDVEEDGKPDPNVQESLPRRSLPPSDLRNRSRDRSSTRFEPSNRERY